MGFNINTAGRTEPEPAASAVTGRLALGGITI